ncbi:hypothetical protein [Urechidicola vernalis]|uniref:Uncharacterized protein n=1 Tax=Urechidicola vernalis TaxID=3075600 RepID=A0ABU2Y4P4_9FLAO|nr:hypothetical protein [Urechidicola sp. P050]MDT0553159.1 hypothetical protein [Urechidicola sp. P050]
MFPYQRKRKNKEVEKSTSSKEVKVSKVKSTVSRVKRFYFDVYDSIQQLIQSQNYSTPVGYTKSQWKEVMENLQCSAYLNLRRLMNNGVLLTANLTQSQLSSLQGYSSQNTMHDWHQIYLQQAD